MCRRIAWPAYNLRLPVKVETLVHNSLPGGASLNITTEDLGQTNAQSTIILPALLGIKFKIQMLE